MKSLGKLESKILGDQSEKILLSKVLIDCVCTVFPSISFLLVASTFELREQMNYSCEPLSLSLSFFRLTTESRERNALQRIDEESFISPNCQFGC